MEISQLEPISDMRYDWMSLVDEVNTSCGYAADADIQNVNPKRDFFDNDEMKELTRKHQMELNILTRISDQSSKLMKNMWRAPDNENDENQRPTEDFKAFVEDNRRLFEEEYYNTLFAFEVDGRSQFHEVPAPLQTRGIRPDNPAIDDVLRRRDGAPEGVNFYEVLMGHSKEVRSTDLDNLGDNENDVVEPRKRGRRLDNRNNHRLSTDTLDGVRSREKLEEDLKEHLSRNKTSQLNVMFAQRALELSTSPDLAKVATFHPIILISRLPSAHLQIGNIAKFLNSGIYVPPYSKCIDMETGSTSRNARPISVTVSPSSAFRKHDRFRFA